MRTRPVEFQVTEMRSRTSLREALGVKRYCTILGTLPDRIPKENRTYTD
jgi:hypothetical protein